MIIDYHVHLERAGITRANAMRFVQQATQRGVCELAFTEHAFNFVELAPLLARPEYVARYGHGFQLADYIRMVRDVARELEDGGSQLKVRLGLEVDYVPETGQARRETLAELDLDVVLGSVHWIGQWGIDLGADTWEGRSRPRACRDYFLLAAEAAASGMFDAIGHPDLVKIYGFTTGEDCRSAMQEGGAELVRAAAESGTCLEVSSAGLRRPVREVYPGLELLRAARVAGIGITLASDAHEPDECGLGLTDAVAWARRAGYTEVTTFSRRVPAVRPLGPESGETPTALARF